VGGGVPLVVIHQAQALVHQGINIRFYLLPLDAVLLNAGETPVRHNVMRFQTVQYITDRIHPSLLAKAESVRVAFFFDFSKNRLYRAEYNIFNYIMNVHVASLVQ
jgi:hypothetical protein